MLTDQHDQRWIDGQITKDERKELKYKLYKCY